MSSVENFSVELALQGERAHALALALAHQVAKRGVDEGFAPSTGMLALLIASGVIGQHQQRALGAREVFLQLAKTCEVLAEQS